MKAVVMAGGFGTRLRPITENLPKPMAYVANRPMMEHVVQLLKRAGITDLEVLLYFYPEKITSYFGSGDPWDVRISYISAETDYGTAGAVKNAENRIDGTFLVISADIITDIDLSRAIEFHRDRKAAAPSMAQQWFEPRMGKQTRSNRNGTFRKCDTTNVAL